MSNVAAGKDTDDEGEKLNNVEKVLNKLGIQLRDSTKEWRNFEDVLDEVAKKWKDFADTERSQIATAIAGTRQQETFAAMMNNWDEVERLTEVAVKSAGTATEKMNIYLDSVEAKTNELKATWENFVLSLNQSGSYKGFLDILQWMLTHMPTVIGTITGLLTLLKGKSIIDHIFGDKGALKSLKDNVNNIKLLAFTFRQSHKEGMTFKEGLKMIATEEEATAMATSALNLALTALVAVITIAVQAYQSWKQAKDAAAQAARDEAKEHKETVNTLTTVIDKYKEIYKSTGDYNTKQENLKQLSEELKGAYENEADALDLLNGKYDTNIKKLQDKLNTEEKLKAANIQNAIDNNTGDLDKTVGGLAGAAGGILWMGHAPSYKSSNLAEKNDKNTKTKEDIESLLKNYFARTDAYLGGDHAKVLEKDGKIQGVQLPNNGATNKDYLNFARDLEEYLEENKDKISTEMAAIITGTIAAAREGVGEDERQLYSDKQEIQAYNATHNEDGSYKQEVQDYKAQLKEQQDLKKKYDEETDKTRKELLKEQLAEEYEQTRAALEKIKNLYNKDDKGQDLITGNYLLKYLGISEGDSMNNNLFNGLKSIENGRDTFKSIQQELKSTGKLSSESEQKLYKLRESLYKQENGETFVEALNDELGILNYNMDASMSKIALQKDNLKGSFDSYTENGQWKSENDENKFKTNVKDLLEKIGFSTNTSEYKQAEDALDGTEESFISFYEKVQSFIQKTNEKQKETAKELEKVKSGTAEKVYSGDTRGTSSASDFKKYLDDLKDAQTMSDKLADNKILDYDDLEKLRKKSTKLREDIDEDGKVTSENLQEYIEDTLKELNKDLDKVIDTFSDAVDDIEKIIKKSDIPKEMGKAFNDAEKEINKDLEDGDISFGDLDIDATNLRDVTDALNTMTVAKEELNNAFSEENKNAIDDTTLSATMMAMSFGDGAMAADILATVLAGADESSLDTAWQMLTTDTQAALEAQGNFNWTQLDASQKKQVLQNLSGDWSNLDAQTRNALASMATYFGTYSAAPEDVKQSFNEKVGSTLQKIKTTVNYSANESRFRRGANTTTPKGSRSGSKKKGSGNSYSAADAKEDIKEILADIEKYEADIAADLYDQTEELINHYDLQKNKLATLKEELDYYEGIYDSTENTTKWLETQNKLLANQSKSVAAMQQSNAKIEKQREKIYKENKQYNVKSWFDSEGNETLAYGDLINKRERKIESIQESAAAKMRKQYNKIKNSTDKDTIQKAKDKIKLIKEEAETKAKAVEDEIKKIEQIYEDVDKLNEAWRDNKEAIRDALAEMADRVKDIRDTLVDQLLDTLQRAVDRENTSLENSATRIEQLVSVQEKYNDILNDLYDTQADLDSELQSNLDSYEYLDEQMRQLMFNEEDYKVLSDTISGIQKDITDIWADHYNQISNLTEDEMYKAEYITSETERQLEAKQKEYELAKAELDVAKAQTNLQNVQNERNTRMLINGQWVWTANPDAVKEAKKGLADAQSARNRVVREQSQQAVIDSMNKLIDADNRQMDKNNYLLEKVEKAIEDQTTEVKTVQEALNNIKTENLPAMSTLIEGAFGKDGKSGYIQELLTNINESSQTLISSLANPTIDEAISSLKGGKLSKKNFESLVDKLGYSFDPTTGKITTQTGSFNASYQGFVKESLKDKQTKTDKETGKQVTDNGKNKKSTNTNKNADKKKDNGNGFPKTGKVTTQSANLMLRSKPSTSGKILKRMPKGSKVEVLAETNKNWAQIKYNGKTGYASRQYLTYDQGGLAYGDGVFLKDVNVPERVLSPRQTKAFENLVDNLTINPVLQALTKSVKGSSNFNQLAPVGMGDKNYYFSNFTVQADNISEFINSLEGMIPISKK